MKKKKTVLGIAGFMGSGKTLAGLYFQKRGAFFINADQVVNELYMPGKDGYRKVVQYFGDRFLDKEGLIDRQKLALFVFSDIDKLKILHDLIHPLVTSEVQRKISAVTQELIVVEATYFEKEYLGRLTDLVLWIECPFDILLLRAISRSHMQEDLARKILKIQKRPGKIDFVVHNDGEIDDFYTGLSDVADRLNVY